jgi:2-aminoethylphosphonate dioxygenase
MSKSLSKEYWESGFLHLKGVFSAAETATLQSECDRLLSLDLVHPQNVRTPYRKNAVEAPERIDPVVDISPLFASLVEDDRIVHVLRDIFQDTPRLFKDKLIFKLPGTDGYTAHQDQAWWQLCPPDDILSVSVQIDGANAQNGGIELFRGYHDRLRTPEGVMRNWTADEENEWLDSSMSFLPETHPGDIVIFHSLTPHRSGKNTTVGCPRRSLYLSYSAARSGDLHATYYEHYKSRENNGDKFFQ